MKPETSLSYTDVSIDSNLYCAALTFAEVKATRLFIDGFIQMPISILVNVEDGVDLRVRMGAKPKLVGGESEHFVYLPDVSQQN